MTRLLVILPRETPQTINLISLSPLGTLPVSLYKPGNVEQEDSIAEKFLEGGDMFVNTADYIFYVTQGGGKNGDKGLKTITDSNFDC